LASVLLRERRFAEAREHLLRLAREPDLQTGALLDVARCDMGLKEWRQALETLSRLPADLPEETVRKVASLRGRCWVELGDPARAMMAFQGLKEGP
jgi:hypothetical protein